jgi:DNA-binding PadR family transcriptional regulator
MGGGFGPRARRGDVRSALLLLLDEEPRNGYGLMQEIERRSGGLWRPSPGSVYPALAQLEDEGLVTTIEQDGKRAFTLTDEGRAHVEANRERFGAPWEAAGGEQLEGAGALLASSAQLAMAIQQIGRGGTPDQLEAARRVVDDARRALYRLLAGDEPPREA